MSSEPTQTTPTVLVVDDEEGVADLYSVWLEDVATVETAYDGESGLAALNDSVDVVLLDRRMPHLSGDQVLETIRERGIETQVAMVSGVNPDVDIVEMGFDDYLTKPVSRDELRDTVERLVARSEYDTHIQELLALVSKRAALKAEADEADLAESEQYRELTTRIERHQEAADAIVESFDEPDIRAVLRDAQPNTPNKTTTSPDWRTFGGLYSMGDQP